MAAKPILSISDGGLGLRIEHLRKSYRKKVVIRDVSMTLDRGEVVALLGPNGFGKTTTFYAIAGLVTPEGATRYWISSAREQHFPRAKRRRQYFCDP